jgi:hypothetical protein
VLAALLDAGQSGREVLVARVAVGDQVPGEARRDRSGDRVLAAGGDGLEERRPPVRGPGDQDVREPARRLPVPLFRVRFFFSGCRGGPVQDVHRGLVGGQHRLLEPGPPELRAQARGGLVHEASGHRNPEQHGDHLRGPFRRHVPANTQAQKRPGQAASRKFSS